MRLDSQRNRSVFGQHRRPPPNYLARNVQLKILVMVFLFMGVLVLMDKVRDPRSLQWMWQLDRASGPAEAAAGKQPATRPARQPEPEPPPHLPLVSGSAEPPAGASPPPREPPESVQQLLLDGWTWTLDQLPLAERRLLRRVLRNVRQDQPLDSERAAAWPDVVTQLDAHWTRYLKRTESMLARETSPLSPEQVAAGRRVVEQATTTWRELPPALLAAVDPGQLSETQRQHLARLQQLLDQRALNAIEDNTPLQRSAEFEAWFRLWEKLRACPAEALTEAAVPVSFVQLFSQPGEYRGRLVRVRGVARSAYYALAPTNEYEIDGYYVFAIQAEARDQSPIRVYSLDVPAGFPRIRAPQAGGTARPLEETVELIGYFFKRGVYASADGPHLAPVVLARFVDWQPAAPAADSRPLPDAWAWIAGIAGAAALAVGVAVWAYRRSNWSTPRLGRSRAPASGLAELEDREVRGPASDILRDLERSDGAE